MEALEESCRRSSSYPCNLVSSDVPAQMLEGFRRELERQSRRLFCDDEDASVDLLEVQYPGQRQF